MLGIKEEWPGQLPEYSRLPSFAFTRMSLGTYHFCIKQEQVFGEFFLAVEDIQLSADVALVFVSSLELLVDIGDKKLCYKRQDLFVCLTLFEEPVLYY